MFERSVKISRRRVRLHLEASDDTADAFLTLPLTLEQLKSLLLRSFPQNRLSDIVIVKGKNADNVAVLMILVICHVEKVEAFPPLFCALNKTKQKKPKQNVQFNDTSAFTPSLIGLSIYEGHSFRPAAQQLHQHAANV